MITGGIGCDIHPAVAEPSALLPYLDPQRREAVVQPGVHDLETILGMVGNSTKQLVAETLPVAIGEEYIVIDV